MRILRYRSATSNRERERPREKAGPPRSKAELSDNSGELKYWWGREHKTACLSFHEHKKKRDEQSMITMDGQFKRINEDSASLYKPNI